MLKRSSFQKLFLNTIVTQESGARILKDRMKRDDQGQGIQNLPSNLCIANEIGGFWGVPDHQQGIRGLQVEPAKSRCKAGAPRSDD